MQKISTFCLFVITACQIFPSADSASGWDELLNIPVLDDLLQIPVEDDLRNSNLIEDILDSIWNSYQGTYSKYYDPGESEQRRITLIERALLIAKFNRDESRSYTQGLNEYSDMNDEEIKKYRLGFKMNNNTKTNPKTFTPYSSIELPYHVDWKELGYVTPVIDQYKCGACWAFSAAGALAAQHKRKTGNLVTLSAQNLLDCTKGNEGCTGGWMDPAFEYVKKNKGVDTAASYPYTAYNGTAGKCHFNPSDVAASCTGYVNIPSGDEQALKQAVALVGPISVAINADGGGFQSYKSGIYDHPKCKSDVDSLDHAVLLVGYGTENGKDYWLLKNSYGTSWGINGYMKLARNKNNQCGIATKASYPLV